jgi:hypothetical protein
MPAAHSSHIEEKSMVDKAEEEAAEKVVRETLRLTPPVYALPLMRCGLCNRTWDNSKPASPQPQPCFHTQEELEAFFAKQPPGPNQRRRWIPEGPLSPELADVIAKAVADQ